MSGQMGNDVMGYSEVDCLTKGACPKISYMVQ